MKKTLGKIKYVSIRDVWPSESGDFTPWLAQPENMDILGNTIGTSFDATVQESPVGPYRADIFTTEVGTEELKVIIENQYGQTNHDHLGKIITYASGKKANIVIWIAEKADDEHRSAIQWLNEHTDEDVVFFLITIKLIQIDNSNPAPIFEIVEGPNDWERTIKQKASMNNTQKERVDFWEQFVDYASKDKRFFEIFSKRKTSGKSYYDLVFGDKRYHFYLSKLMQKGRKGYGITVYMINQKELYNDLKSKSDKIEKDLGTKLNWKEADKVCTIRWIAPKDLSPSDNSVFAWFISAAIKCREVFAKYVK